ncbi:zinc finger protein [Macleaya cordata]|uniref:Zinc finger protein n=1 Tax=Macleaya cordata TaxID=56857 RepID=A0A200PV45_MACCD|nr:zinc finger protein [Macleaya cordata]
MSSPSSSYFLPTFNSRKLFMHTPIFPFSPNSTSPNVGKSCDPSGSNIGETRFDSNVVMVLSVLLCALICSLGLNSIIRCVLWCKNRVTTESNQTTTIRLVNTGVKRKTLNSFPTLTYSAELTLPGLSTECIICLSEFGPGEPLRILPKCNHGFHQRCIDKWLTSHSSCPTCRRSLVDSSSQIIGCNQASSSEPPPPAPVPPPQATVLTVEPEGLIRNYRGDYQG